MATSEEKPQSVTAFRIVLFWVGVSRIEKKRPGGKKGGWAGKVRNQCSFVRDGNGAYPFLALCQNRSEQRTVCREG